MRPVVGNVHLRLPDRSFAAMVAGIVRVHQTAHPLRSARIAILYLTARYFVPTVTAVSLGGLVIGWGIAWLTGSL